MTDSKIVIIGTGFVGSSLAKHLMKDYKIQTLSRNDQPDHLKKYKISHSKCDITNYNKLEKALGNPFLIIHTAATAIPEINDNGEKGFEIANQGTDNICKIVAKNPRIHGLLMLSTMRVFGEYNYSAAIDEESAFRINYTRKSARRYVISQIVREFIVRSYSEMNSSKFFGILRISTVIGTSRKDAFFINSFIETSMKKEKIITYKHTVGRPIFFIDLNDVCTAIGKLVNKILLDKKFFNKKENHILNLSYPKPLSILESACCVRDSVKKHSKSKIIPKVIKIDTKSPNEFVKGDKNKAEYDISKIQSIIGIKKLLEPKLAIEEMIKKRFSTDENNTD